MTWITFVISILGYLFQYGPQLVALVKEIMDMIKQSHPSQQPALTAELGGAVKTFQATGNKRPLLELMQKIHDSLTCPDGPKAA
jgi:hypothetical protein